MALKDTISQDSSWRLAGNHIAPHTSEQVGGTGRRPENFIKLGGRGHLPATKMSKAFEARARSGGRLDTSPTGHPECRVRGNNMTISTIITTGRYPQYADGQKSQHAADQLANA